MPDLHFLEISNDGLVYIGERGQNRIQVFQKDGTWVENFYVAAHTRCGKRRSGLMSMMRILRYFQWLFASAAIAGCGGGGGVTTPQPAPEPEPVVVVPPNILLVISDDLGLDASSGYQVGTELPVTPTLDMLAANGLIFDNAWANPICSPTGVM